MGATHAIAVATDNLIEDLKISEDFWMTLQIGSRQHRKEGLTGETWKVPVSDFTKRALHTQSVLAKLSNVLNSGQFITNYIGFSASVLFTRPERKGGKRAGSGPGQKIWDQMAKEIRCVCEIKNKDELYCARAIVTIRGHVKRQAGQQNTFENFREARGKNSQQVKEAKRLHKEAGVPERPCGLEDIAKFQDYLGPRGYSIIVVDAVCGGVIFKGDAFREAEKTIALVKSVYMDDENAEKAHYDGLYSIPGFMNRGYFWDHCCKGYNTEDSAHHNCQAHNCPASKQSPSKGDDRCPDFTLWSKPDKSCKVCRREFYGETCFANRLIQYETLDKDLQKMKQQLEQELDEDLPSIVEMKSVCDQFRCCKDCLVSYKVKEEVPHKCLHAKCKHCLEYVHIYDNQRFITSEEEKQFKRRLQDLRSKKKKKEKLFGIVVEGLPDDHTQSVIYDLIVKRKKKLKDLKEINSGVPMVEIMAQHDEERLNDLRAEVMEQMMDEGVSLDDMTLDMVDERMAKLQDKQPQTSESKKIFGDGLVCADIECIVDSTNTFIPILICYTRGHNKTIFHHWGTNCVDLLIQTLLQWAEEEKSKDGGAPQ